MFTTFHIKANELDEKIIKSIKELFKSKRITITVEEEVDETEYLIRSEANKKMLERSIKSKEGYELSDDDFNTLRDGGKIDFTKSKKIRLKS